MNASSLKAVDLTAVHQSDCRAESKPVKVVNFSDGCLPSHHHNNTQPSTPADISPSLKIETKNKKTFRKFSPNIIHTPKHCHLYLLDF